MERLKQYLAALLAVALVATPALSGSIKVWSNGEYITATDLNAALAHLHANLGHGHGAIIVNSDVSASAGIAHTKMATPALLPKLWSTMGAAACGASPCTLTDWSVITSVTRSGAGVYVANFTARANASYAVFVTSNTNAVDCYVGTRTTTTAAVSCFDSATGAVPTDASFSLVLMDSDN